MSQPAVTDDSYLRTDVKPPKLGKGAVHKIYTFLLITRAPYVLSPYFFLRSNLNGYRALHALSLSLSLSLFSFSDLSLLSSLYLVILADCDSPPHWKKKKIPNPYRFLRFETFPSAFDRSYNFYRKRIRTGFLFNQDFALYTFLLMHEHRSEHPRSLSIPPRFISTYIVIFWICGHINSSFTRRV